MKTQTKQTMSKVTSGIVLAGLCAVLAGCAPRPTMPMRTEADTIEVENNSKYEVKRVAVFKDRLAYENRRGIYEITDKETGKTYIGVSGIGITEKAIYSTGKSAVEVEH